ncbi:hypothetical protein PW52_07825 [Tamlana sedimentorum]|uniref:Uncharacterized protein n=1 Tax=Neotamlana sedimentorum TaxID=1435349 RepID=A0A0D7WD26_9FLAO|nr:hypothetical protein PW52_07825 [Tamlana sedimentorum]
MKSLIYFKIFSTITFCLGFILHLAYIVLGRKYFFNNLLTTKVDAVLSIPILLTAIFSYFSLRSIKNFQKWKQVVFILLSLYLTISIPLHVKSWFSDNVSQIKAFPKYYSYFILPIMGLLIAFVNSLEIKKRL